jgi:hypothetical protein
MKYTLKTLGWSITAAMLCVAVVASAAVHSTAADTLVEDTGDGIEFISNGDGSITIHFPARTYTRDSQARGVGEAMVGTSQAPFVGDYTAAGIHGITFTVTSDGDGHQPHHANLVLEAGGHVWTGPQFSVATDPNTPTTHRTPLDAAAGWGSITVRNAERAEVFAASLASVTSVAIAMGAGSNDAEDYTISDCMLVGPDGFSVPVELGPLGAALMNRFGKASLADLGALGSGDKDGDGFSDLEELLAGTDDNDAASVFAASVVGQDETSTTIQWSSASPLLVYKVLRGTSLTDGLAPVATGLTTASAEVTVSGGTSEWVDDTAPKAGGPYFYRVVGDSIDE